MKKVKTHRNQDKHMAHVLYQRLGKDWYAFTEVDGQCYMTKLDDDFIHAKVASEKIQNCLDLFPELKNKKVRAA